MTELFHLAEGPAWDTACATGRYEFSTRGLTLAEVGFVHCSLAHQIRGVAERFYADADDLVLLVVDADRVGAPVVFEAPTPGAEEFPHVYGPIPVEAVVDVRPVRRDATGRFVL